MKYLIITIGALWILTGCKNRVSAEPASTIGQPVETIQPAAREKVTPSPVTISNPGLPSFQMLNAGNQVINLSQFKGKKVFVNLWATWCPPCRAEIPSIESLAAKTDHSKAEFVMLSLDDDFEIAKSYAAKNKMKLPVYFPAGNLPPVFTVDAIPVTILFNEKGEIIFRQVGTSNYNTKTFLDLLSK